ncbi:2-hydroxyacid dehydrogenase [Arachidicoccus terrestris]|uniref:2-hydroxyacid dehydrogenase n=1 Tax=Arachidicoccus terrestris TaxID=2875539 RepID=UPI001CC357EE|nr:2-hydroxyacid dehydrogenase [Arachidicoccus terrestris]UAY55518.1 2-hydroxyacid dehydrogenase [Arachidicoccus terrestris]
MSVLITAPYNEEGLSEIASMFGEVCYRPWKTNGSAFTATKLIELLQEAKATALITEHDHVTREVIEAFPKLQFIGVCRGTPSNLDLEAAKEKGIAVFYTPARNAQAVVELLIANVITLLRKTLPAIDWLESGKWEAGAHTSYLQFKGSELAGKTVGLVGFGAIGRKLANILKEFPCTICYYDPYYTDANKAYQKVDLEALFTKSDIISIHLPNNKETEKMIDRHLIGLMSKDAIFVNTARAAVVDRQALLEAIKNGQIRGAVLDVFDQEPPDAIDYQLIRHPHVLATPHIAGASFEVEDHHVRIMNDQLKKWYNAKA